MWLVFVLLAALALAAVLLVVLGLVAAVVVIASALPWLLIVAGIWLLVRATRGQGHAQPTAAVSRRRPASTRSSAEPTRQPPSRPLPPPMPRRELPIDVQIIVEQIRRKAEMLAGYADRFPPLSRDLHIVRRTAADYLPRTVAAYLALPGTDDPVIVATGTTALHELREQLQLMDVRLDQIALDLQRQDLDQLLANRRFLEERFRPPDRDTRAGSPPRETDAA